MDNWTGINRRTFLKGAAIASAAIFAGGLTGCASTQEPSSAALQEAAATFGRADNEIFTYEKPDQDKTQLVLSVTGLINAQELIGQFEAKESSVQVIPLDLTGGNVKYHPYLEWLESGYRPDVMMVASNTLDKHTTYFEDLTDQSYTTNYDTATLLDYANEGHIYFLPGPKRAQGIIYNETLFNQYGWQFPNTIDEFIALCDQITADTGGAVMSFNPNAKYENELTACFEGMLYGETLAGTSNRTWLHDFKKGNATFVGHMEPFFDLAQRFIDHGILNADSFNYSATTRLSEFKAGKTAMINGDLSEIITSDEFTFNVAPFPGQGSGRNYLYMTSAYWGAVPSKDRGDAERQAVDAFMSYISSEEGQAAYIGDRGLIASTAGAQMPSNKTFTKIGDVINAGDVFTPEYFILDDVPEAEYQGAAKIKAAFQAMTLGQMTESQAVSSVDEAAAAARANRSSTEPAVAKASADFTILEVSNLFADMFKEKVSSDVALVLNNAVYRGNVMRIFTGDITASKVTYLKPRSFDNGATLVKATMTGAQLLTALDDPLGKDGASADCVYAFAGLKATVAPWAELGSKMQEVTMADGTAIDDAKNYQVAFWDGTVNPSYYDAASAQKIEGTFDDVLTAYLKEKGTIAPVADGRITLVWD